MTWSLEVTTRELPNPETVERFVRVISSLMVGQAIEVRVRTEPVSSSDDIREEEFTWRVGVDQEVDSIVIFGSRFVDDSGWSSDLIGWWGYSISRWTGPTIEQLFTIVLLGVGIATMGDGYLVGGDFGRPVASIFPEDLPRTPLFTGHQAFRQALRYLGVDSDRIDSHSRMSERWAEGLTDDVRKELAFDADWARAQILASTDIAPILLTAPLNGPERIVHTIETAIDSVRAKSRSPEDSVVNPVVRQYAALLGEQICRAYGWNWCRLHWNVASPKGDYFNRFEALAVADPDLAIVFRPETFLRAQLLLPATEPLGIFDRFASLRAKERPIRYPDAGRGSLLLIDEDSP